MIRFVDGPAAGVVLSLRRTPVLLRVVRGPGGNWDALDQLDDTPAADEAIHVYRCATDKPTACFWHGRGKGGRRTGGMSMVAEYSLLPFQPSDEEMRTNEAWAAWCASVKDRVLGAAAPGDTRKEA